MTTMLPMSMCFYSTSRKCMWCDKTHKYELALSNLYYMYSHGNLMESHITGWFYCDDHITDLEHSVITYWKHTNTYPIIFSKKNAPLFFRTRTGENQPVHDLYTTLQKCNGTWGVGVEFMVDGAIYSRVVTLEDIFKANPGLKDTLRGRVDEISKRGGMFKEADKVVIEIYKKILE